MTNVKKRGYVAYADILRIFASFSVVLLHVSGARVIRESVGTSGFLWALFYDCVTRWSVPLFIMLSGMLFLKKDKKLNVKTLYTKNVLRMVTAFIFWSFVYNLHTVYHEVGTLKEAIKPAIFRIPNGAMHTWFIFVIIGLYIILPFVKRMTFNMTKREAECFIALSFLLTFVTKSLSSFEVFKPYLDYALKFEINFTLGYVGLFVAGWYIDSFEHKKAERYFFYFAGVAGFLYMFFTTAYFSQRRGMLADEFMSFKSVGAFTMALAVMMLAKQLFAKKEFSKKAKKSLKTWSKYTFGIYLVHELFLNISTENGWFLLWEYPYVGILAEAATVFLISYAVTAIISLFPWSKYIS